MTRSAIPRRHHRLPLPLVVLAAAVTAAAPAAPARAAAPATMTVATSARPDGESLRGGRQFVVRLKEAPTAIRPAGNADAYRKHLSGVLSAVLEDAGARTRQTYSTIFNGFSATLTGTQAAELAADHRVAAVTPVQVLHTEAPGTEPARPAAPQPGGGAGTIVAMIGTGIWPESPSFAGNRPAPTGWHGTCQAGDGFPASTCTGNAVLGARHFADTWLADGGSLPDGEILSARDMDGHGTYTASVAAGVPVEHSVVLGRDLGPVAGVAPAARIAVYKAFWGGMGYDADVLAALDAAVADGVGVIALAGRVPGEGSAVGTALRNADQAGVLVIEAARAADGAVAGRAAVLRSRHPAWSPGAVTAALRTTTTTTTGGGGDGS
ncbi:S8 family serine peptidase [Actinoplanes sp. NPDC051494]|uniref:S8 family serine peptidase n=1 Tax=Actinoplanes sp. NPDC051494 TaxID=3363907 RepID=UPI0037B41AD9